MSLTSTRSRTSHAATAGVIGACIFGGLVLGRDPGGDDAPKLRTYTASELAAARPAERPGNCGEVLPLSSPGSGNSDLRVMDARLSPAIADYIAPVFLERRIDVVLKVRALRTTYISNAGLQGRVSVLDQDGRVIAGHPLHDAITLVGDARRLRTGRTGHLQASLSNCDLDVLGVPPGARLLYVAPHVEDRSRLSGTVPVS